MFRRLLRTKKSAMPTTLRIQKYRSTLIALHLAVTVQRIFCVVPRATVPDRTCRSFGGFSFPTAAKSAPSACHKIRTSIEMMVKVYHGNCRLSSILRVFFKKIRHSDAKRIRYLAPVNDDKNDFSQDKRKRTKIVKTLVHIAKMM